MRKHITIEVKEKVITLASEITYGQRAEWCSSVYRPLKMSMIRSRQHFYYDPQGISPVIVFFCGGGFTEVDRNVWVPEISWFAKRGYTVVSVDYSVTARTRFPMQLEDCKLAIRYLRAHAEEYKIDPERIVVMGESAGGYMSGAIALTGDKKEFDVGEYLEYSSKVKGAVCFYPGTDTRNSKPIDPSVAIVPPDIKSYIPLPTIVTKDSPPIMFLHGTADTQVSVEQSELLYDALQKNNVRSELYIIEGAEHADAHFVQPEVKELVLGFIDSIMQ